VSGKAKVDGLPRRLLGYATFNLIKKGDTE
jgi:hypothetical protein